MSPTPWLFGFGTHTVTVCFVVNRVLFSGIFVSFIGGFDFSVVRKGTTEMLPRAAKP